jgi:LysR family transcriptional regulator, cyn operon transcriptional activator
MELSYLKAFYEVAKAGSFTEAAKRLHISQSALSKAVALLEEQQGVRLFMRSKRGITLTSIGQDVFARSERLFGIAGEIEVACKGHTETVEGPLNLGASDHVASYLLVSHLQQLIALYPGVLPRVFSGAPSETINLILTNEIEFGLFFTQLHVAGIHYEVFLPIEMVAVAAPKLLPKKSNALRPAIETSGFIGSIKAQYQHHPAKEMMQLLSKSPKISLESNSQEMQKRFCLQGGGVAYLAKFMVEDELERGSLVQLPLKKPIFMNLYLATRKGRDLSLSARTFLGMMRES